MKNTPNSIKRGVGFASVQKGVATLSTTVVLLIAVTLISLNSSKRGVLELLMSNNYESQHTAFNQAESGLDALYTKTKNIVDLNDPEGQVYCTADPSKFNDCDETKITAATGWPTEFGSEHEAQLIYDGSRCPPRTGVDTGCARVLFSHYTLRSIYDDTANKGGTSQTVMGAMELLPKFQ